LYWDNKIPFHSYLFDKLNDFDAYQFELFEWIMLQAYDFTNVRVTGKN